MLVKKLLILLLALALFASVCFGAVRLLERAGVWEMLAQKAAALIKQALEEPQTQEPAPDTPPPAGGEGSSGVLVEPDAALCEVLYAAAQARQTEVDVARFGYTAQELQEEVSRFFFTNPALFYVEHSYRYYTLQGETTVQRLELSYLYTAEQSVQMNAFYESAVQGIVSGIPAGATDFDKVMYLHDYLVQNYVYDYEGLSGTPIRDAYNFFKTGRGVCQAYMLAMIALCDAAGIPALPVISDEMEHAWNLVKLDGEWYHVDVTWDDAGGEQSPVYPSYVSYDYFLLSSKALYNGGRTAKWYTSESATSTRYDSAVWRNTNTAMVKLGEYYYCTLFDTAAKCAKLYRGSATQMTPVQTLEGAIWYSGPTTYYQTAWAGLAVWDGALLISTNTAFWLYDVQSATLLELADLSLLLGELQIFGICGVDDTGVVSFVAARDYHGAHEVLTWQIPVNYRD